MIQEYVLGLIAAVGLAYGGWYLWNDAMTKEDTDHESPERLYADPVRSVSPPKKQKEWVPNPTQKSSEPRKNMPEVFTSKVAEPNDEGWPELRSIVRLREQTVQQHPAPDVQKPKLTGKELKEKAIQELLGR